MILQLFINIMIFAVEILLVSASIYILYIPSRFFHIAHAVTIVIAPYFVYWLVKQIGVAIGLAIPVAIGLTMILGMLSELCVYKPLRKKGAGSMVLLIVSIGLYTILQNCVSILWGDETKNLRMSDVAIGHKLRDAYITDIQMISFIVSVCLFTTCILFLKYHKTGRCIRAVSSNPELSNVLGINSNKIILCAFAIGSTLAAVAGILIAFDTGMTPTMGFNWLLYGIVVMIIGGIGSSWGLIGGAFMLATAEHLSAYYIGSQWMDAVAYIILILFLLWKPLGFSGKRLKKVEI